MTNSTPGPGPASPVVGTGIVELAYAAAIKSVELQDGTLGNLRNRATALLSAATVAATFAGALGLFSNDPSKGPELPAWSQWVLLVLLVAVGSLCLAVMWPVTMAFGVDPRLALERAEQDNDLDSVRRYLIRELVAGHGRNFEVLKRKFLLYRLAVLALTCESTVLLLALILKG